MMGVLVAGRAEKKTPAAKVAAPPRARGNRAVKAAPATHAEATAVVGLEPGAAVVAALTRPSRSRPAAKAAAAMRGEPEPDVVVTNVPDDPAPAGEPETPAGVETHPIVFCGRTLMVKLPTPEQLTMYRRLSTQFQDLARDGNADRLTLDEALRHLDRAVRLVQSILAEARDKEWLEDQILEGNIELQQCTTLLKDAFVLLNRKAEEQAAGQNRQTRRARARLAED